MIMKKISVLASMGVVLTGLLALGGCSDDEAARAYYQKENAARRGHRELVGYCRENHLDLNTFKGPYFHETLGLDFHSYTVCYKHPVHYFCYNDYTSILNAGILTPERRKHNLADWLDAQPDITPPPPPTP